MAPFDRSHTTFYWYDIVNRALSCTLEIWVRGHSRSFKLVPFESLGEVSDSLFIVTKAVSLTVYEIFNVNV